MGEKSITRSLWLRECSANRGSSECTTGISRCALFGWANRMSYLLITSPAGSTFVSASRMYGAATVRWSRLNDSTFMRGWFTGLPRGAAVGPEHCAAVAGRAVFRARRADGGVGPSGRADGAPGPRPGARGPGPVGELEQPHDPAAVRRPGREHVEHLLLLDPPPRDRGADEAGQVQVADRHGVRVAERAPGGLGDGPHADPGHRGEPPPDLRGGARGVRGDVQHLLQPPGHRGGAQDRRGPLV